MKFTIIYDNKVWKKGLKADWGFSCLVKVNEEEILFDTGANGSILLHNMEKLGIDPAGINKVFISHAHGDHTGGLSELLMLKNTIKVYIPASCPKPRNAVDIVSIRTTSEILENIFSTGELNNNEQSMAVKTEKGAVIIVGCSHPGADVILRESSKIAKPYALIGGLHGFKNFSSLSDLSLICPCHCTQHISSIASLYPGKYIEGGAGKVIEI